MIILRCIALLVLTTLATEGVAQASHGWPLEPTSQDHPIGNNLGDFWLYQNGRPYQHPGIDILAAPFTAPDPPYAVVTVPGTIFSINSQDLGRFNEVQINGNDGIRYIYMHLARLTFTADFLDNTKAGNPVGAGDSIANVHAWGCGFDHLHYELIQPGVKYLNPLTDITPNPDDFPPQVEDIQFADRTPPRWSEFGAPGEKACAVVKGNVDIIAKLRDRDDAGAPATTLDARNVGAFNLRWRACAKNAPLCTSWNDTHRFDQMPLSWRDAGNPSTARQYSASPDWVTTADECSAEVDQTFRVLTGDAPFAWNTAAPGAFPDGSYTVTVEATDIVGNMTTSTALACVQNTASACTTDLTIRDGDTDSGATPYLGSTFWMSPAIEANPGTQLEDTVQEQITNVIGITTRNTGSCPLPVGTPYTVCLGWSLPSGFIPFPLAANQTVGCKTETVTTSDWLPGEDRATTFTWVPPKGSLPTGHSCLVAWSDMAADPVQVTPSVILDNNRAQRNISFVEAPPLNSLLTQTFYVHHLDVVAGRSMEISFKSSDAQQYVSTARLHLPPTVRVARVAGAQLIGAYRQIRPRALCAGDEASCRVDCPDWENAARRGCTVVLGRIDPEGSVQLEGLVVDGTAQVLLEIDTRQAVPPESFFDAEVVEFGTYGHEPHIPLGGLTLRFKGPARR